MESNWEIIVTDEFENWYMALSEKDSNAVNARVALLEEHGPNLKRPVVGEIEDLSTFGAQMKELRVSSGAANFRVLFIFDPLRRAVLLLGGDKTGSWHRWYRKMVPVADRIYERYLREIGKGD